MNNVDEIIVSYIDSMIKNDCRDEAMDYLYDIIDTLIKNDDLGIIDKILLHDPTYLEIDTILGILTTTLPAKNSLTNRQVFFEKAQFLGQELLEGLN